MESDLSCSGGNLNWDWGGWWDKSDEGYAVSNGLCEVGGKRRVVTMGRGLN